MGADEPTIQRDWDSRYRTGATPWDTGHPSPELIRLLEQWKIPPSRALELGCGTGTNAIYLAQLGFDVTACDISPLALERAKQKAFAASVSIDFRQVDLTSAPEQSALHGVEPFPFAFDRGVYHTVREMDLETFLRHLEQRIAPGGWYFVLAGNADEARVEGGPPRVSAATMLAELEPLFALHHLRRFRFHGIQFEGVQMEPLAWSAVFRRRE